MLNYYSKPPALCTALERCSLQGSYYTVALHIDDHPVFTVKKYSFRKRWRFNMFQNVWSQMIMEILLLPKVLWELCVLV